MTSANGSGAGPYAITLSAPPPPRECVTFTFAGTTSGQKLQYQVLPGDTNLNGIVNTQDLLRLVQSINAGTANIPGNLARFDIDRSGAVNSQDLLRLVQLLNGTNATQAFNGATVAGCP